MDHDAIGSDDKMFHFCMHTSFIRRGMYRLPKMVLDKAIKDKSCEHFEKEFAIEVVAHRASARMCGVHGYIIARAVADPL